MHVMVDLETLSLEPDAAIVSIGAVKFLPGQPNLGEFYRPVLRDLQERKWGRRASRETEEWWKVQSEAARFALVDPAAVMLDKALLDFTMWLAPAQPVEVWGYGSTFDNVVLTNAYSALGLVRPWHWRSDKCFRTLKWLAPDLTLAVPQPAVEHNALDDAKHQAAYAALALQRLKEGR